MITRKIFAILIITVLLTAMFITQIFITQFITKDGNQRDIDEIICSDSLENAIEKNEIALAEKNAMDKINSYLISVIIHPLKELDKEKYIKMYQLKSVRLIDEYNKTGSFYSLISSEYCWKALVKGYGNKAAYIIFRKGETPEEREKNEGKWYVSEFATNVPVSCEKYLLDRDSIKETLRNNGLAYPDDIKYINATALRTNLLYIKKGTEEYAMSFSTRPEFSALENGKLYKISEMLDLVRKESTKGGGLIFSEMPYGYSSLGMNSTISKRQPSPSNDNINNKSNKDTQ